MQDLYLIHHGVEGQQWGKRNGPPYPLDSTISTGKRLIEKHKQNALNRAKSRINRYGANDKKAYVDRKTGEFSFKKGYINATTGLDTKIATGVVGGLGSAMFAGLGLPSVAIANAVGTAAAIGITEATRRLGNKYYNMKIDRYRSALDAVENTKISDVKAKNPKTNNNKTENKPAAKKNDLASRILNDQEYGDRYGRSEAKKYGLDQGDNYKMFRDAAAGDKRAQQVVDQWKSNAKNKK